MTYGTEPAADVRATRVERGRPAGSTPTSSRPAATATLDLRLAGRFNVHNALAVVALGEALGLDAGRVRAGLADLDRRARSDGADRRSASPSGSLSTSRTARHR